MVKSFVSRSTFRMLTLALNVPQTITVEGDEVLAQVLTTGQSVQITRQREREIAKTFPAHSIVTTTNSTYIKPTIAATDGLVRLENNPTAAGALTATTHYHVSVALKEEIAFNMFSGTGTVDVLIEIRHYIPSGELTV